jgi:hypothetical protein
MYLLGIWPEFLIRGLEVLGLGPEPKPLQMDFFKSFLTKILSKLGFQCSIPRKMVFVLVSDRIQSASNSKVLGRRPNPRVQILPPEYLGNYEI